MDFYYELTTKFDKPFINLMGVQGINHGLWTVAVLAAQDLFKQYIKLDPGEMTLCMSIIHLPWSVKILYGLLSDNVPIAGSRRRSYIIIMGLIQFFSLIVISMIHEKVSVVVALLALTSMAEAFMNVVVDAMLCKQARKDPEHGSQDLISFSWMATGVGGIMGCVIGGVMTQYFHPRYSFLLYSIFGMISAVNGMQLTKESESDQVELNESQDSLASQQPEGFYAKLRLNISQIISAIKMPEIYLVILYFVFSGLTSPDFSDFSYYFMLNVIKLSKFQYSMLGLIGSFTGVLGTIYFEKYLKDIEVRTLIYYATICSVIQSCSSYAFACRLNLYLGINDVVFIICTDTVFGVMSLALFTLPIMALFAKITPHNIEGTVFAFLTGTVNMSNTILSPMIGVYLNNKFVGVTATDLSGYKNLCFFGIISSFIGFLLLPLIPLKDDIAKWQSLRQEAPEKV